MKDILTLSDKLFHNRLDNLNGILRLSTKSGEIVAGYLSKRPFHLNVIESACRGRFKETGHSLVLADMLKHEIIQKSFIASFLDMEHEFMDVTAEIDRVDVALKSDDMFVIIENKVNAANEQENQVYRYVHEIGIDKYKYKMSQIYVIYLNPTNRDMPSDRSLCDKNGQNNVFTALCEDHYRIKSYKHDITNWLRGLKIDNEQHISSALDQYIDFLENKFHTSLIDKDMNEEIRKLIADELHLEEKSYELQIKTLDEQLEKVKDLSDRMAELKIELRKQHSHEMMLEWQKRVESLLAIQVNSDSHSFGIKLNNGVWLGIWDGLDNKSYLPYWGFQFDNYSEEKHPEIHSQIEEVLTLADIKKTNKDDTGWVAWYETQKGVERFVSLFNAAQKKGLI